MATEYLPRLPLAFSQAALFGALVLVGLAAGEALRRYAALPRITGYVLAGAALGPHALRLIRDDMLVDLRPLGDLSVGLIVFELGFRLDFKWKVRGEEAQNRKGVFREIDSFFKEKGQCLNVINISSWYSHFFC